MGPSILFVCPCSSLSRADLPSTVIPLGDCHGKLFYFFGSVIDDCDEAVNLQVQGVNERETERLAHKRGKEKEREATSIKHNQGQERSPVFRRGQRPKGEG